MQGDEFASALAQASSREQRSLSEKAANLHVCNVTRLSAKFVATRRSGGPGVGRPLSPRTPSGGPALTGTPGPQGHLALVALPPESCTVQMQTLERAGLVGPRNDQQSAGTGHLYKRAYAIVFSGGVQRCNALSEAC